jgi:hypothetical protein
VRSLISASPQASITDPAQTGVGTGAAVVLASNPKRKGFMAQNTGTTVVKLGFGSAPSQTAYHVALRGGTAGDDATGSLYVDDAFTGDVWAISSSAGGTMVIAEFRTGKPDWNSAMDWGVS